MGPDKMDWSGYEPVAVIGLEPAELASTRGLTFRDGHDDLDHLSESVFRGLRGTWFGLVRHLHSPEPGTELLIRAANRFDARRQLLQAMRALQLSLADLLWISPELYMLTKAKAPASPKKVAKKGAARRRPKSKSFVRKKAKKKKPRTSLR
jgi:hypothetical protein